jgi:hypothetical protein
MTKQPEGNEPNQAAGFKLSLDGWAVALALVLSLLIWAGLIKRVPW